MMKKTFTLTVSILFFTLLILGLMLSGFNQAPASAQGVYSLQTTPTPPTDVSVIGSTDGILIMGIVIVLIVTVPLLFRKRPK